MARQKQRGRTWIRKSTRFAIYARDGFKCVYCQSKDNLSLDHYKCGNNHTPRNLLTCCISCNSKRKDKTIRQWFAELRSRRISTKPIRSRIWRRLSKPLDRVLGRELAKTCERDLVECQRIAWPRVTKEGVKALQDSVDTLERVSEQLENVKRRFNM